MFLVLFLICICISVVVITMVAKGADTTSVQKLFKYIPGMNAITPFSLDNFRVYSAPASGPRGFVTMGFDNAFFEMVKQNKIKSTKWFVGGSTAALRFCCLISSIVENKNLTDSMREHFTEMTYKQGDTPQVLSPMMEELIDICAPSAEKLVTHPQFHLAIMVAHFDPCYITYKDWSLKMVFLSLFFLNLILPKQMSKFYKRTCFYTGPEPPPFITDPSIEFCPITANNLKSVLRATTCVPFVSERVESIPGLEAKGLFYDGAICDYHMNVCITDPEYQMLFLGDVPDEHVKQSFFDVIIPWRGAPASFFQNCSVIKPSHQFVESICGKRLPNVSDWFDKDYIKDPEKRKASWRSVYSLSLNHWGKQF